MTYKSIFRAIGVAVAVSFFGVGCGSGKPSVFVGSWVYYDGNGDIKKMELLKDGSGMCDDRTISWKVENNRFVVLSQDYGMTRNYNIAGSDLTLIDDDGDSTIFVKKESAKAFFKTGMSEKDAGNYDNAIAGFTEAIRLDTGFSKAYTNRAKIYIEKKDYDNAIADYTEAVRLTPNDKDVYAARAGAYFAKKDYAQTIADYTEVIRMDSNDMAVYLARGEAYSSKKDYENAIEDLELVLQKASEAGGEEEFMVAGGKKVSKKEFIKTINGRIEKNSKLNIDPRLIGIWQVNGWECWVFKNDGTGSVGGECASSGFKFTILKGQLRFRDVRGCEGGDCWEGKIDDLNFSFSDNGNTLILGKDRLKKFKGNHYPCC